MEVKKGLAIVTGVSRLKGMGSAICKQLAINGVDICFTYWTPYDRSMPWGIEASEPDQIQEEIRSLGVKCEKLEINLADDLAAKQLFDFANDKLGAVTILVNNATHSVESHIATISPDVLDQHYKVNVKSVTLLIKEFVNRMEIGKRGSIVNISSGQSLGQMNNEVAYAITKGAIDTLTKTIYSELAAKGITINAVNPGPNDTGWMGVDLKQEILSRSPMGRVGLPSDTAKLISFLCSEDASWITGQLIHSEGGFNR